MGWTSYHATHYKNGRIDRKAECDSYFMGYPNSGIYNVKKSAMVGSVYYAAVERLMRYNGLDENGNCTYELIPEEERVTRAVVFLTATNTKDYYNFSYKDMDETMGPCESRCPKGILALLSPTDSEWANDWRKRCLANAEKITHGKLPVGTVISFDLHGKHYELEKMAPAYQFKTPWWYSAETNTYFHKNHIPENFTVLEGGV